MEHFNPEQNRNSQKQEEWNKTLKKIEKITDGLGMEIDPKIKETVGALNILGYSTTGSCEGHLNRGLLYPWVDIGDLLDSDERFQELSNKCFDKEKEEYNDSLLTSEELEEYNQKRKEVSASNKEEVKRLATLLDEFYINKKHELVADGADDDWEGSWNTIRLEPHDARDIDAKSENLSLEDKRKILEFYQREMLEFTNFLKDKYFRS